jgi:hypothetical protein
MVSRLALVLAAAPIVFFVALLFVPSAAWAQGDPLGPEFRVNTYTTDDQRDLSVTADSSGNFVVVWQLVSGGHGLGIFGQRYANSGTPLGAEFRVNTVTAYTSRPSVTADSSGNFVVVWPSTQDGSIFGIFGQRFASTGAPLGPEFRVNTYTTGNQDRPSVATDASGNFVVVWWSPHDGGISGVFGQRFASSGAPLGPEFQVNSYTFNTQSDPSVASDSSGNFVVVWRSFTQDGSDDGVFGQRYASSGTPLGAEFRVNTYTTEEQSYPSVSSDSSGSFVVAWESYSQDGSSKGVFGQRYDSSGAPLGPEFRVNTNTPSQQYRPDVAADASGNFVVVWHAAGQDGSAYGVAGQRYDSSGTPSGPEFRVNTYSTNHQRRASVTADSTGNFVVVWTSEGQDGSDDGVFGQRYSQIVPVELMHFRVE